METAFIFVRKLKIVNLKQLIYIFFKQFYLLL